MKKGGGTTTLSRYKKRESLCNSIVAQKTSKRTNEEIQRKNKREKERSGDYDTLLHSGVSLQLKEMLGKGGYKASYWGNGDEAPRRPPSGVPNR